MVCTSSGACSLGGRGNLECVDNIDGIGGADSTWRQKGVRLK
jgi:hypothetical protein